MGWDEFDSSVPTSTSRLVREQSTYYPAEVSTFFTADSDAGSIPHIIGITGFQLLSRKQKSGISV